MDKVEEFEKKEDALDRLMWLLSNSYKATIWWRPSENGKVYCISSCSVI